VSGGVEFVCGGCGRREGGWFNRGGDALKPTGWYSRTDDDGTQVACGRHCIEQIAKATAKTACVLPI
jgi:hypothetical protein